ncbi:MAG: hypothetical protein A2V77_20285 [Anaeromyxobacter sp. RBG_16_69_14]|nr:MAG: hypothetical protein A2V77_20285 [Anaeromyxobacter sp. RBG_16_69_14]
MRKARWTMAVLILATGTAYAQAEQGEPASGLKGTGKYGTAGCGLGSLAFGDQKGGIQIIAATLNGTGGNQTFGITSGTSNCGEATVGVSGTKVFIEGNREALSKDAARGSGETIDTLTVLAGCKDSKVVGATLQKRFSELFPGGESTPAEKVSDAVIGRLRAEPSLACGAIG